MDRQPLRCPLADPSPIRSMPLAQLFAEIIEIGCLESVAILGHWEDSRTVADGVRVSRPTFLLAVPRVFEKVYNTAQQQASASGAKSKIFAAAASAAVAYSKAQDTGGPGLGVHGRHATFDQLVASKTRAAVGC